MHRMEDLDPIPPAQAGAPSEPIDPLRPPKLGRKRFVAPPGLATIRDAAERREVTEAVVRRAVRDGEVRSIRTDARILLIDERDLEKIRRHDPPVDRRRIAVQLVPSPDRHARWLAAARSAGLDSVTEWLYQLADAAVAVVAEVSAHVEEGEAASSIRSDDGSVAPDRI